MTFFTPTRSGFLCPLSVNSGCWWFEFLSLFIFPPWELSADLGFWACKGLEDLCAVLLLPLSKQFFIVSSAYPPPDPAPSRPGTSPSKHYPPTLSAPPPPSYLDAHVSSTPLHFPPRDSGTRPAPLRHSYPTNPTPPTLSPSPLLPPSISFHRSPHHLSSPPNPHHQVQPHLFSFLEANLTPNPTQPSQ